MNPDGISYLDVGDAFVHHDWAVGINGWWSPLYAWTLGIVVNIVKPAPQWEFPLVHAVNFAIFAFALFAFGFFLRSLLASTNQLSLPGTWANLPESSIQLLGYAIFLWISLEVITVYDVSPDLAVSGFVYLMVGALLRLRQTSALRHSLLLGVSLGVGYWTKAILLPVGLFSVCVALLWSREKLWRRRLIQAVLVFAFVAAPFIVLLSAEKHRFTFGDSGKVNYAWAMSNAPTRNWQGGQSDAGQPLHPTRLVLSSPPVYEFNGPVVGTYPPWTDPSYWNQGIRVHFRFGRQMRVLATTVPSEARLLLRSQPALVAEIVFLLFIGGMGVWVGVRKLWPILVIPLAGMGAFIPIIENDRYIGAFVLVFFVVLLACTRVPDQKTAKCLSVAVFIAMALGTVDLTVRIATHHPSIPGNLPTSTDDHVAVAQRLWTSGIHPGDSVAVIGDGTGAYWARLGKFHIVAEVMGMGHGAEQFWKSPEESRAKVCDTFLRANAKIAVGACPAEIPEGWQRIPGTPFCFRRLRD